MLLRTNRAFPGNSCILFQEFHEPTRASDETAGRWAVSIHGREHEEWNRRMYLSLKGLRYPFEQFILGLVQPRNPLARRQQRPVGQFYVGVFHLVCVLVQGGGTGVCVYVWRDRFSRGERGFI